MRGGATDGGGFPLRMMHELRQVSPDGAGGTIVRHDGGVAVWARLEPLSAGAERETPDGFSRLFRVTLRSRPVSPGDRLTGEGIGGAPLRLVVRRAVDPDGTRRLVCCDCAEETGP